MPSIEQPKQVAATWTPPEVPSTFAELLVANTFDIVRDAHTGRELDTVLRFLRTNQPQLYEALLASPVAGRTEELASILQFLGSFPVSESIDIDEILSDKWEFDDASDLVDR